MLVFGVYGSLGEWISLAEWLIYVFLGNCRVAVCRCGGLASMSVYEDHVWVLALAVLAARYRVSVARFGGPVPVSSPRGGHETFAGTRKPRETDPPGASS
jgi:hypothetical protein